MEQSCLGGCQYVGTSSSTLVLVVLHPVLARVLQDSPHNLAHGLPPHGWTHDGIIGMDRNEEQT